MDERIRKMYIINTRNYKGHTIDKMRKRTIEYYQIDGKGYYLFLRDAKAAIDKENE